MKNRNLFATIIVLLTVFSSCEKCFPECNLVPAKIIRYDCDRVIFELQTTDIIGDPVWEDVQTGQRYSNVVSYYNNCEIGSIANGKKITLHVTLKEPPAETILPDCYRCEAMSQSSPQTMVDFAGVSIARCEDSANH